MIRILRGKTSQIKQLKSGKKKVETKTTEISGFRVKGRVKVTLIGDVVKFEME